jgi:hypothetical protein
LRHPHKPFRTVAACTQQLLKGTHLPSSQPLPPHHPHHLHFSSLLCHQRCRDVATLNPGLVAALYSAATLGTHPTAFVRRRSVGLTQAQLIGACLAAPTPLSSPVVLMHGIPRPSRRQSDYEPIESDGAVPSAQPSCNKLNQHRLTSGCSRCLMAAGTRNPPQLPVMDICLQQRASITAQRRGDRSRLYGIEEPHLHDHSRSRTWSQCNSAREHRPPSRCRSGLYGPANFVEALSKRHFLPADDAGSGSPQPSSCVFHPPASAYHCWRRAPWRGAACGGCRWQMSVHRPAADLAHGVRLAMGGHVVLTEVWSRY